MIVWQKVRGPVWNCGWVYVRAMPSVWDDSWETRSLPAALCTVTTLHWCLQFEFELVFRHIFEQTPPCPHPRACVRRRKSKILNVKTHFWLPGWQCCQVATSLTLVSNPPTHWPLTRADTRARKLIDIGGTNKKGELIVWQRPRILCTLESRAVAELESSEWPIENEDSIEDRQCPSDNSTLKSWQQEKGAGEELEIERRWPEMKLPGKFSKN